MSESPFNPVAVALAHAIRDATGLRLCEMPFMSDEIYRAVIDRDKATAPPAEAGAPPAGNRPKEDAFP